MATVLVRVDKGGHRARALWTRHTWSARYRDPATGAPTRTRCGQWPDRNNSTVDTRGVQGEVRDCVTCARLGGRS
jgi:hypothetical protein